MLIVGATNTMVRKLGFNWGQTRVEPHAYCVCAGLATEAFCCQRAWSSMWHNTLCLATPWAPPSQPTGILQAEQWPWMVMGRRLQPLKKGGLKPQVILIVELCSRHPMVVLVWEGAEETHHLLPVQGQHEIGLHVCQP